MKSYSARRSTIFRTPHAFPERSPQLPPRSLSGLLEPLEQLASTSSNLVRETIGVVESGEVTYEIPRYVFLGPKGETSPSAWRSSPASTATNQKVCMRR